MGRVAAAGIVIMVGLATPRAPAVASEPRWALSLDGGIGLDAASQALRGRGELGLRRSLGRRFEVSLLLAVGHWAQVTELGPRAGAGARFRLGPLTLAVGVELGYYAQHVTRATGWSEGASLWTGALVLGPRVALRLPLGSRLELRAHLLDLSLLWNNLWNAYWEPKLGVGFRF